MDAEKLYNAYRTAVLTWARSAGSKAKERLDKDGKLAVPSWAALPDGARPWFAAAEEIAARLLWDPPTPVEYQITDPIVPLVTAESGETIKEHLPSTVHVTHIPTRVMYDVDRHRTPGARQHAAVAACCGLDMRMLAERLSLADAFALEQLVNAQDGPDLTSLARAAYLRAGGPLVDDEGEDAGWDAVMFEALVEFEGDVAIVRTRCRETPVLRIGPLRMAHLGAYDSAELHSIGVVQSLALAAKVPLASLEQLRVEDTDRAWMAFEALKKKARVSARQRTSPARSTPSTAGGRLTSPT